MVTLSLYVDVTDNALLISQQGQQFANPKALPFFYGDTLALSIWLYARISNASPQMAFPFQVIPNNATTPLAILYDGTIDGAETPYAAAVDWEPDPTGSFVTGTLNLSTAALAELIGENEVVPAYFGIGYIQNGVTTTCFKQQVNIGVGVLTGVAAPPPGLTPLSLQAAKSLFLPIQPVPGQVIYLATPLGKVIALEAVDDGGPGHIDFSPTGETV